jgi:hypothetical protein
MFNSNLTLDVKIRNRACGGVMSALGKAGGPLVCWSVVENACVSPDNTSLLIQETHLHGSRQASQPASQTVQCWCWAVLTRAAYAIRTGNTTSNGESLVGRRLIAGIDAIQPPEGTNVIPLPLT